MWFCVFVQPWEIFTALRRHRAVAVFINARMSDPSEGAPDAIKKQLKPILSTVTWTAEGCATAGEVVFVLGCISDSRC